MGPHLKLGHPTTCQNLKLNNLHEVIILRGVEEIFCKIEGKEIPLVSTGTSPFAGAGQFGKNARVYRKKFLNNTDAMLEILEACYKAGGRGFEAIPFGKINEAAKIMKETHSDFVITGSTFPGPDPLIEDLIDIDAQVIFVHASVSDKKDERLSKILDDVASRGLIPGIAVHNPVSTLEYALKNLGHIKAFLVPFNSKGEFMDNQKDLEEIVDSNKDCSFVGMKTLAAGKIKPKEAYEYISKHNICAVAIGMVTVEEAEVSTKIALDALQK